MRARVELDELRAEHRQRLCGCGHRVRDVHVVVDVQCDLGLAVGAQLDGNSVVLNTLTPLPVTLSAGHHVLSLTRGDFSPAPGDGGAAALYAAFLTPAQVGPEVGLTAVQPSRWRSLCSRSHEWVEVVH